MVRVEYAGVYSVDASVSAAVVQTAVTGVCQRGDTRRNRRDPGNPPSRANAYIIREVDVRQARPHR